MQKAYFGVSTGILTPKYSSTYTPILEYLRISIGVFLHCIDVVASVPSALQYIFQSFVGNFVLARQRLKSLLLQTDGEFCPLFSQRQRKEKFTLLIRKRLLVGNDDFNVSQWLHLRIIDRAAIESKGVITMQTDADVIPCAKSY